MIEPGYADSGHIFSVEFDPKVKVYWWLGAMGGMVVTFIGIPLAILWLVIGIPVHNKQFQNLSCDLTDRSINMRMGWLFKKQQNIPLDKLTDVSIHEGPILNAFGVVRMHFETAGSAPFILTGVKDGPSFRDRVLQQRDSLSNITSSGQTTQSNDVLVEIRDLLQQINENLSSE
ncbi:MAG: PH domain-containing protein [Candidatus Thermoplasmatota archaeon]|jgi:putative membrane protein|nr:PH domain-containing protein [Candidatus Thalassarchaeaceae archaeon]MEE2607056.1 PH domain-containing protein [Candidatus Thermoplasmatota archaeon]